MKSSGVDSPRSVGRPNVGKSTLLNALVGQKLSIVTPRPQTTRHRILGIVHLPQAQIAFVDTPGLHHGETRALNRAMNRAAASALVDADLCVFVVEALRWSTEDSFVLERIVKSGRPAIAVVNKVDEREAEAAAPAVHGRARRTPHVHRDGAGVRAQGRQHRAAEARRLPAICRWRRQCSRRKR